MTDIAPIQYVFEGHEVQFIGTPDNPAWVAKDVCSVLDIKNPGDTLADFEEEEKGIATIYTLGGEQQVLTIKEAGLYRLIFKSRKPVARRFQKWIFNEVLPSIRKHGSYSIPQPQQAPPAPTPAPMPGLPMAPELTFIGDILTIAGIAPKMIGSYKLGQIVKHATDARLRAMAADGKALLSSEMSIPDATLSPTQIGEALAKELGSTMPIKPQAVNLQLQALGLQVSKTETSKTTGKPRKTWHITDAGKEFGQMQMDTAAGHGKTVFHPRWFPAVIDVLLEPRES